MQFAYVKIIGRLYTHLHRTCIQKHHSTTLLRLATLLATPDNTINTNITMMGYPTYRSRKI